MIIIHCSRACAHLASPPELLTAGMAKAVTVEFAFTEDWDGLTKTAVFTNGRTTVDVLQPNWQGNTVAIPAEVLTTAGRYVRVGVYGSNADGVALPTIWAELGKVRPGADPSGDASTDPALPVWAQLQEIIGNLDDLTTKAKNTLVAAINEAAKTGSGGSGSIDLRVADGYIQYSNDGGTTWENLIALAELKGEDGAPGTPGKDGTNGQDGYSPSASVSETDTGATITITDKTGTTTAEIKNGKDGKDGAPGKDGTNGADGSPGAKGDTGATPNLQIGTVTTLPAGSDATASMGGTAENPLLNLGIPKGADGEALPTTTSVTASSTDAQIPTAKAVYDAIPHPETKTATQTQPIGVDADGKLWTQPGGGSSGGGTDISLGVTGAAVGQLVKITAVDADGKPTAWAKLNRDWAVKETYPLKDMTFPAVISIPQDSDSMLTIAGTDITVDGNTNIVFTMGTARAEGGYSTRFDFAQKMYAHSWGCGMAMVLLRQRDGIKRFRMRRTGWSHGYDYNPWEESLENGEDNRNYYRITVDDATLLNPDTTANVVLYTRDALC